MIKAIFNKYSRKSREQKVKKFFEFMRADSHDTILDVGAGVGEGLLDIWRYFKNVIVVDLNFNDLRKVRFDHNNVISIAGNACDLPLTDKSVDYVFSNALIEHIPESQRYLFVQEIKRVSRKGYFITTPNFWFPFEPHYLFLCWQYLPKKLRTFISSRFSLGHYHKGAKRKIELLSRRNLENLFPGAHIYGIKLGLPIPVSLVCWHRNNFEPRDSKSHNKNRNLIVEGAL